MPITKRNNKYYWGSKGPFETRKKAGEVAQAAHASGYDKSLEKEGDGGGDGAGSFGLNGTVFTSSHAGIFTPTFGEHKTRKRHRKNKHKQDHKRKKLMGKDKKNGVERLADFLYEHSPVSKASISGMRGNGPAEMATGQQAGTSAWNNRTNDRFQNIHAEGRPVEEEGIDWDEYQKGISKVESHPTMGMNSAGDGKIQDVGKAGVEPLVEDKSAMINKNPSKPQWVRNTTVIKAGSHANTLGIGTNQNTEVYEYDHPQKSFTEKKDDKDKRSQVIEENDFEHKAQGFDDKDKFDATVDPPRAAGAVHSMGQYPNANMQMMEKTWGSGPDTFAQDNLHRQSTEWFPNDESVERTEEKRVKKLHKLHIQALLKGVEDPLSTALRELDNDNSI